MESCPPPQHNHSFQDSRIFPRQHLELTHAYSRSTRCLLFVTTLCNRLIPRFQRSCSGTATGQFGSPSRLQPLPLPLRTEQEWEVLSLPPPQLILACHQGEGQICLLSSANFCSALPLAFCPERRQKKGVLRLDPGAGLAACGRGKGDERERGSSPWPCCRPRGLPRGGWAAVAPLTPGAAAALRLFRSL